MQATYICLLRVEEHCILIVSLTSPSLACFQDHQQLIQLVQNGIVLLDLDLIDMHTVPLAFRRLADVCKTAEHVRTSTGNQKYERARLGPAAPTSVPRLLRQIHRRWPVLLIVLDDPHQLQVKLHNQVFQREDSYLGSASAS